MIQQWRDQYLSKGSSKKTLIDPVRSNLDSERSRYNLIGGVDHDTSNKTVVI